METSSAVSPARCDSPESIEENTVVEMSSCSITVNHKNINDVKMDTSLITTHEEGHKIERDGSESDKAHTESDDEEEVAQHKDEKMQEIVMPVETLSMDLTTPVEENTNAMMPVETVVVEPTTTVEENTKSMMPVKTVVMESTSSVAESAKPMTPVETLPIDPMTSVEKSTDPMTPVEQSKEHNFEEESGSVVTSMPSEKIVEREAYVQKQTSSMHHQEGVAELVQAVLSPLPSPAVTIAVVENVEVHGNEIELKVQDKVEIHLQTMEAQKHEVELVIPSPKRSAPLNLVHYDIDDEESDSEEDEEDEEDEEVAAIDKEEEEGADLGTPLGYGVAADFSDGQTDFASHRFMGPSVSNDPASVSALHSLRRVALHEKPPRFVSSAPVINTRSSSLTSSGGSSTRNSSGASVVHASDDKSELRSQSAAGFVENSLNAYTLTFTEPVLGFSINVVMSLENELLVEVWSVEKESPAQRSGVAVGDNLVSVNGQRIEPHMTKEQVDEMIETASVPRTLVFQRDMHDKDVAQSKNLPDKKHLPAKPLIGRLGAAVSQGASIIGSKWKRKKTIVHDNSFCDGCGLDPIIGALWSCSICSNYNLCSECYDAGTHGMENSEQVQELNEAIVQYKLQKKCKHYTPEFLLSLRRDICKGRPDKFEYLGEWIANIVVGTSASKIVVRGIEIPSLPPAARQRFVSHLMPLVSNRTDIEVHIEWLPDDTDQTNAADRASVDRMSAGAFDSDDDNGTDSLLDNLEKLRIWISDRKTRTTSPFA